MTHTTSSALAHEFEPAAPTLPEYAPMLAAYHRAYADHLRAIVAQLPLRPGDHVLDMACGDGSYTPWLAERVAPSGRVTGVDIAPAYLELAQQHAAASPYGAHIEFQVGSIAGLPFADDTFDLVWCAQSLYTLPDPIATLHELRRVTRPSGTVAILENDLLHHIIIPWPTELELELRCAQQRAFEESTGSPGASFSGRQLCSAFSMAGLASCTVSPFTSTRHAPLSADEATFLRLYLRDLQTGAWPYLDTATRQSLDLLLDEDSPLYLLKRPDFYVMCIDLLAQGTKPS